MQSSGRFPLHSRSLDRRSNEANERGLGACACACTQAPVVGVILSCDQIRSLVVASPSNHVSKRKERKGLDQFHSVIHYLTKSPMAQDKCDVIPIPPIRSSPSFDFLLVIPRGCIGTSFPLAEM